MIRMRNDNANYGCGHGDDEDKGGRLRRKVLLYLKILKLLWCSTPSEQIRKEPHCVTGADEGRGTRPSHAK